MPPGAVSDTEEGLLVAPLWWEWPDELTTRVLRDFAERHGVRVTARHLKEALAGSSDWPGGWRVRAEAGGHLTVRKGKPVGVDPEPEPMRVDRAGDIPWGERTLVIREALFDGPVEPGWLALSQERWPVFWVRSWLDGDRIRPLGLRGHSRKLQDVWTDAKVPVAERRRLPVLADDPEGGVVLMVPGLLSSFDGRVEHGAKVWLVRLL
jgi:tRNA(Ile)-lysidine synthase